MKNIVCVDDDRCGNETIYSLDRNTLREELSGSNFFFDGMSGEESVDFVVSCARKIPVEQLSCDIEVSDIEKYNRIFSGMTEEELLDLDIEFIRAYPLFTEPGGEFVKLVDMDSEEASQFDFSGIESGESDVLYEEV